MKRHILLVSAVGVFVAGCHTDMWVQPRVRPLQQSDMFVNQMASRPLPKGTVARGFERADTQYYTGRNDDGTLMAKLPLEKAMREMKVGTAKEFLDRGQEVFKAFCTPCHGQVGDGKGMIAMRGLDLKRKPANYHSDKLRKAADGHFFDVITNGSGIMFPYGPRIQPHDRWAVVAYIRALQMSQHDGKGGAGQQP